MAKERDLSNVWTLLGGLAALATIHVLVIVPGIMGSVEERIDDNVRASEERIIRRLERLEDVVREEH